MPDWGDVKRFFDPGNLFHTPPSNAPTQYANEDQFQALFGSGTGNLGQNITNYRAPQIQQQQMQDAAFRNAQLQQMGQLQGIASGQQQGAGELAAQRQIANALAAQQAQARMARGGNSALAARNAANQSAALGVSGVGLGQQAALQDQQMAQNQLSGLTAAGRQADYNNAGLMQQVALANQASQQQANQMNSGNYLQLLNQSNQRDMNKYNADLGIGAQQNQADAAKSGGLLAGLGAMFSDERLKTDIADSDEEIDDMLDAMVPKAWVYKDSKHGKGRWSGVMAQDMERSKAGARVVSEHADGKVLDTNKTISTLLASAARLNQRLRKLEDR